MIGSFVLFLDHNQAKQSGGGQEDPLSVPISSTPRRTLAARKAYEEDDEESCQSSKKGIDMVYFIQIFVLGSRWMPFVSFHISPIDPIFRK